MDSPPRYRQRTDRPLGPDLKDFIYKPNAESDDFVPPIFNTSHIDISQYKEFNPRENFIYDHNVTWYPPHMASAMVKISKKTDAIDCILEVRDARAPFTSANESILTDYPTHVPRLVVLNKRDLVPLHAAKRACEILESTGKRVMLLSALNLRKLTKIRDFVAAHARPKFQSLGIWMLVAGLPNVGKSSLINALKRHYFVQRWHTRHAAQLPPPIKTTRPKAESTAGTTRLVSWFQVSDKPKMYCYDTPGIMLLKQDDPDINLKLAALGCIQDHKAGEDYIADYILYRLNKASIFNYVEILGLGAPSNDIAKVVQHIAQEIEAKHSTVDPQHCFRIFNRHFRNGNFGKVCLDRLDDVIQRSSIDDAILRQVHRMRI